MDPTEETARLLAGMRDGNSEDRERLFSLVYEDLRKVAHLHLRGQRTGTLGTTAMVNEAYLRLAGRRAPLNDRVHFMAVASRAMRSVLIDHARAKLAQKRGGGVDPVEIEDHHAVETPRVLQVLALEEALERLAEIDERLPRVVELRFYGGLTFDEAAEALSVSKRTVERDWTKARAYLHRWLSDDLEEPDGEPA